MDDRTVGAIGVFVLVAAGTVVAGAIQGQLREGVLIGFLTGGMFGVLTFILLGRGE